MSDLIPNCYHLVNSQYLKKEDRHSCLVKASEFDGWLIPDSSKEILNQYPQYLWERVYDPIIDESKEVQGLLYRRKSFKDQHRRIELQVLDYAIANGVLLKDLEFDEGFISKKKDCDELMQSIEQIDREINFHKNKKTSREISPEAFIFPSFSFNDVLAMPPKEWIVDQIFGNGDLGIIYGPSGCGKTFIVIDFILKLCSGKKWAHRFNVARPLNVAYCAGEGVGALPSRFQAAAKHHGITQLDTFTFFNAVPQLYDEKLQDHVAQFISEWRIKGSKPIDLLVIDTLHTAIAGADENSSQHMGVVIKSCKLLIKELGCSVLLVHHTNKDESSERGSGSPRGACDFMIQIKRNDSLGGSNASMECSKLKDGEMWKPQNFNLSPVPECKSVHIAWDVVSCCDEKKEETKDDLKNRIMQTMFDYPNKKFTCKALALAVDQKEIDLYRLLNELVKDKRCIKEYEDISKGRSRLNPWVFYPI